MTEYTNFDSVELSADLLVHGDVDIEGTLTAGSIVGSIGTVTAFVATPDNGTTQTLTAAMVASTGGGVWVYHTTTGGTTPSLTLPLASALIAYIPDWTIGDSYTLRVINANSGVATIVTNTGITLTGTATVNNGSQADFAVTYTGTGTVSVVRASVDATNNLDITASTGTLTIANGSSFITSGAYSTTLTATNTTTLTMPTTGTLATLAGTETFTNKTLTSPTLTTPSLGVASATTINKVALTAPATGSTITVVDGKTLIVDNSLEFAGTDSTVMTFPSTSATIARTDAANTFTGTQTLAGALVGGSTSNITINTNKFTVAASTGNTLVAGTLSVTGHVTLEGVTSAGATGTNNLVFSTSPTFITPTLGAATATSINGNTITTGTGTLTLAAGITLTGPATSGTVALINPPPQAGGSTLAVTAAMSGKAIKLDTAGGTVATLPAATGTGNKYRFVVTTSTTSAAHKILAASGSDFLIGNIAGQNSNTVKQFTGLVSSSYCSLQMPNSGSQPSGGIQGDWFEFHDVAANLWAVSGMYSAGTTPTTPFSTATT